MTATAPRSSKLQFATLYRPISHPYTAFQPFEGPISFLLTDLVQMLSKKQRRSAEPQGNGAFLFHEQTSTVHSELQVQAEPALSTAEEGPWRGTHFISFFIIEKAREKKKKKKKV